MSGKYKCLEIIKIEETGIREFARRKNIERQDKYIPLFFDDIIYIFTEDYLREKFKINKKIPLDIFKLGCMVYSKLDMEKIFNLEKISNKKYFDKSKLLEYLKKSIE